METMAMLVFMFFGGLTLGEGVANEQCELNENHSQQAESK